MKLNFGKQIQFEDLAKVEIDIFIMAVSHEKRFITLHNKEELRFNKKIILSYQANDVTFYGKGSVNYKVDSENFVEMMIYLLDFELNILRCKKNITILIDYSSMTKSWYYTIMSYFTIKKLTFDNVKIYFSYTPSTYSKPLLPKYNSFIDPIPGRFNIPNFDKPKALIVGLGYESKKAEGIIEYLDPKITFALYSNPSLDKRFSTAVEENNKNLILDLKENIIQFPFDDLMSIERILTSLYFSLRDNYSVIIAPLGPKPFTFIAMLLSIKYEDIDVWRVSSGNDFNKYDREPIENNFIICEVDFVKV